MTVAEADPGLIYIFSPDVYREDHKEKLLPVSSGVGETINLLMFVL